MASYCEVCNGSYDSGGAGERMLVGEEGGVFSAAPSSSPPRLRTPMRQMRGSGFGLSPLLVPGHEDHARRWTSFSHHHNSSSGRVGVATPSTPHSHRADTFSSSARRSSTGRCGGTHEPISCRSGSRSQSQSASPSAARGRRPSPQAVTVVGRQGSVPTSSSPHPFQRPPISPSPRKAKRTSPRTEAAAHGQGVPSGSSGLEPLAVQEGEPSREALRSMLARIQAVVRSEEPLLDAVEGVVGGEGAKATRLPSPHRVTEIRDERAGARRLTRDDAACSSSTPSYLPNRNQSHHSRERAQSSQQRKSQRGESKGHFSLAELEQDGRGHKGTTTTAGRDLGARDDGQLDSHCRGERGRSSRDREESSRRRGEREGERGEGQKQRLSERRSRHGRGGSQGHSEAYGKSQHVKERNEGDEPSTRTYSLSSSRTTSLTSFPCSSDIRRPRRGDRHHHQHRHQWDNSVPEEEEEGKRGPHRSSLSDPHSPPLVSRPRSPALEDVENVTFTTTATPGHSTNPTRSHMDTTTPQRMMPPHRGNTPQGFPGTLNYSIRAEAGRGGTTTPRTYTGETGMPYGAKGSPAGAAPQSEGSGNHRYGWEGMASDERQGVNASGSILPRGYETQMALQQMQLRQGYFEREQEKHLNTLRGGFVELCRVVKEELNGFQQQLQEQSELLLEKTHSTTTEERKWSRRSYSKGRRSREVPFRSLKDYATTTTSTGGTPFTATTSTPNTTATSSSGGVVERSALSMIRSLQRHGHSRKERREKKHSHRREEGPPSVISLQVRHCREKLGEQGKEPPETTAPTQAHEGNPVAGAAFLSWLQHESSEADKAALAEMLWPWLKPKVEVTAAQVTATEPTRNRTAGPPASGTGMPLPVSPYGVGCPDTTSGETATSQPLPAQHTPWSASGQSTAFTPSLSVGLFSSVESFDAHIRAVVRQVLSQEDSTRWATANRSEQRYQEVLQRQDRAWQEAHSDAERRQQQSLAALEVRLRNGWVTQQQREQSANTALQHRVGQLEVAVQGLQSEPRSMAPDPSADPTAELLTTLRREMQAWEAKMEQKLHRSWEKYQQEQKLQLGLSGSTSTLLFSPSPSPSSPPSTYPSSGRPSRSAAAAGQRSGDAGALTLPPATLSPDGGLPHTPLPSASTTEGEAFHQLLSATTEHVRRLLVTHQALVDTLVKQRCAAVEGKCLGQVGVASRSGEMALGEVHHLRQEVRRAFGEWGKQLDLAIPSI